MPSAHPGVASSQNQRGGHQEHITFAYETWRSASRLLGDYCPSVGRCLFRSGYVLKNVWSTFDYLVDDPWVKVPTAFGQLLDDFRIISAITKLDGSFETVRMFLHELLEDVFDSVGNNLKSVLTRFEQLLEGSAGMAKHWTAAGMAKHWVCRIKAASSSLLLFSSSPLSLCLCLLSMPHAAHHRSPLLNRAGPHLSQNCNGPQASTRSVILRS